ncbi:hypothetical protein GAY28_22230, partial [Azospirillum brasilense]|nr:hypothetical protein [Azospirillum brasilense]
MSVQRIPVPPNLIRLAFRRRPVPPTPADRSAPFVLTATEGHWSLRGTREPLDAAGLVAAADTLRAVARPRGQPGNGGAGQPAHRSLPDIRRP